MTGTGIKTGVKLDLTLGDERLKSTFYRDCDDGSCLISLPVKDGASYTMKPESEFLMSYLLNTVRFSVNARLVESVREGVRTYLRIMPGGKPTGAERRAHARMSAHVTASLIAAGHGGGEAGIFDACTLDISTGGAAIETNAMAGVGEVVSLTFQKKGLEKRPFAGEVCWLRRAAEHSEFANIMGLRFVGISKSDAAALEKLMDSIHMP